MLNNLTQSFLRYFYNSNKNFLHCVDVYRVTNYTSAERGSVLLLFVLTSLTNGPAQAEKYQLNQPSCKSKTSKGLKKRGRFAEQNQVTMTSGSKRRRERGFSCTFLLCLSTRMRVDLSRRAAHAFCALKLSWGERAADVRIRLHDLHTAARRRWRGQISKLREISRSFSFSPDLNQRIVSVYWSELRRSRGFYAPECGRNGDDSDRPAQHHICATVRRKSCSSPVSTVLHQSPLPRFTAKPNPCALWVKVCACLAADHRDASAACASAPLRSCQRGFKRHAFRISREVGEDESPADNPPASPPAPGETSRRLTPNF